MNDAKNHKNQSFVINFYRQTALTIKKFIFLTLIKLFIGFYMKDKTEACELKSKGTFKSSQFQFALIDGF